MPERLRALPGAFLRGAAQVFFVDKPLAGAVWIAAIALNRPGDAVGALLGLAVATLVGMLVSERASWARGLCGYNGVLVGIALAGRGGMEPVTLASIAVGSALTVPLGDVLGRVLKPRGLAPLTFPFLVVTWATLALWRALGTGADTGVVPAALSMQLPLPESVTVVLRGLGQVFLQGDVFAGLIVAAGLFFGSWRIGVMAAAGAALGGLVAFALPDDTATPFAVVYGAYGYDAALCAAAMIAIPEGAFAKRVAAGMGLAVVAPLIVVALAPAFVAVDLPPLTSSFVLLTTLALLLRKLATR